jgi:hypothetical protein
LKNSSCSGDNAFIESAPSFAHEYTYNDPAESIELRSDQHLFNDTPHAM